MKTFVRITILFLLSFFLFPLILYAKPPIEKGAIIQEIYEDSRSAIRTVASDIQRAGYICDSVSSFRDMFLRKGYIVRCNDFRFKYSVERIGNRILIKSED